jgi:hypothetical protein
MVAVFFLMVCSGCGDDTDTTQFHGVGKLVAERNDARMKNAGKKAQESGAGSEAQSAKAASRPSEIIVEESVTIVSDASGRVMATGKAFLDKDGKIITIRITGTE